MEGDAGSALNMREGMPRKRGIHYQTRIRELGFVGGLRSSCKPNDASAKGTAKNGFAFGHGNQMANLMYRNMSEVGEWNPENTVKHTHHGGIFGLDFTPDGSILGAACENRSLLLFDPLTSNLINCVDTAHLDCANAIRFLDNRLLASCSDDMTVKLWDVRNLRQSFRTMRAHNNWVKNIEFINDKGLLLSSAFDGNVFSWDINDASADPKRLFYTPGLMRMRLTPDATKMLLSTHWGYLLAVHNLDLNNLPTDLSGFKPNMYWLMIKSRTHFASSGDHVCRFTADRNRTEMILDFPEQCDPENISSLSPHPQGWCLASRSNNHDERSEWTCIHDLQLPTLEELIETGRIPNEDQYQSKGESAESAQNILLAQGIEEEQPNSSAASAEATFRLGGALSRTAEVIRLESGPPFLGRQARRMRRSNDHLITLSLPAERSINIRNSNQAESTDEESSNVNVPRITINSDSDTSDDAHMQADNRLINQPTVHAQRLRQLRNRRRRARGYTRIGSSRIRGSSGDGTGILDGGIGRNRSSGAVEVNLSGAQLNTRISLNSAWSDEPRAFFIRAGHPSSSRTIVVLGGQASDSTPGTSANNSTSDEHIPKTYNRLVYYAEEPRVGRGFIKEQCWSNDGRVLASPHGFGVRLLSFSPSCDELCDVPPSSPNNAQPMSQIAFSVPHSSVVLCTKFSPTHSILASGCLRGKVVFQQPNW